MIDYNMTPEQVRQLAGIIKSGINTPFLKFFIGLAEDCYEKAAAELMVSDLSNPVDMAEKRGKAKALSGLLQDLEAILENCENYKISEEGSPNRPLSRKL